MRSMPTLFVAALITVVAACGSPPVVEGWRGADIHLVDGVWIGTEYACSSGDVGHGEAGVECRTIIDLATAALEASVRDEVTKMVLATLPRTYVTADGQELTPRMAAGVMTRKAVVIDSGEGSRHVIGLWCYLAWDGAGNLQVSNATCAIAPLEDWRDGTVPRSSTPGGLSG